MIGVTLFGVFLTPVFFYVCLPDKPSSARAIGESLTRWSATCGPALSGPAGSLPRRRSAWHRRHAVGLVRRCCRPSPKLEPEPPEPEPEPPPEFEPEPPPNSWCSSPARLDTGTEVIAGATDQHQPQAQDHHQSDALLLRNLASTSF